MQGIVWPDCAGPEGTCTIDNGQREGLGEEPGLWYNFRKLLSLNANYISAEKIVLFDLLIPV
jgi:hypothetical protein